jgi:hypothetical protein
MWGMQETVFVIVSREIYTKPAGSISNAGLRLARIAYINQVRIEQT